MLATTQPVATPECVSVRPRLESVDLLRGLIMVVMALDHVRGWFTNVTFYPLDLDKTNVALFLTRWVTHFCAPGFIFLAGTGAFLSTLRGKSRRELSWFLFTRGLWIVFLELIVVRCFGWQFNFDFHFLICSVLWAIGWSMVVLAGLVWLPVRGVAMFAVVMIVAHNLFDNVKPESWGQFRWLWVILHSPGELHPAENVRVAVPYVLVPWMGVMALGYAVGSLWQRPIAERRKWLLGLGCGMTFAFFVLRLANGYGDPTPWAKHLETIFGAAMKQSWSEQTEAVFAFLSLGHCQKYPPSLHFILMTLGPLLIALAW
ncbi:MAG: hypothetical protein DME26_04780, partial [Verrucomicrobia bacterium]